MPGGKSMFHLKLEKIKLTLREKTCKFRNHLYSVYLLLGSGYYYFSILILIFNIF